MTREQLDLLIRYINLKAECARREACGQTVSPYTYEEITNLIGELEESIDATENRHVLPQ